MAQMADKSYEFFIGANGTKPLGQNLPDHQSLERRRYRDNVTASRRDVDDAIKAA